LLKNRAILGRNSVSRGGDISGLECELFMEIRWVEFAVVHNRYLKK